MTDVHATAERLQEQLGLLRRVTEEAKILTAVPNRPQALLMHSKATFRAFFGGNKSGKSTGGIWEDISHMVGYRPFYPQSHPDYRTQFQPPVSGMIFGESWDKVDEIHTPKFEEWLPKSWGPQPIKRQGQVRGWRLTRGPGRGSEIKYATYEMDPKKLEGADKHFYHFDEPPPYSFWHPVVRGIVVHGGRLWMTLTLLDEGWVWDEIWERAEAGDPDYFGVVGDIRDNLYDPSTGSGALTEANIKIFEKTLDESTREVRLHGKPQHLQGRIFKMFKVAPPWVVEPFDVPDDWPCVRAIDPAQAKPVAVLWARVAPSGRLFVTDELFDPAVSGMDDLRDRIKQIESERRHRPVVSLMDEAGEEPNLDGVTMFQHFANYGIRSTPAPRSGRLSQIMRLGEGFKVDPFTGSPRIVVFNNCQHLAWELKRYTHPSVRKASSSWGRYKELPQGNEKKDDDLIDCLKMIDARRLNYDAMQVDPGRWVNPTTPNATFAEEYGNPWAGGGERWEDAVPYERFS